MKKIPLRMCIVTREKLPKKELIRVVKFNDEITVDETGKKNGKGCYLKKDIEVINKAKKRKVLNNVFDLEVDNQIYEDIINVIK